MQKDTAMKQLNQMGEELEKNLENKKLAMELQNAYDIGKIKNIEFKILAFNEAIKNISTDPTLKRQILINFEKTKQEIITEINNL